MFPRGKVNEGESHETAAAREVLEEIGYDCSNLIKANEFIQYNETKFKQAI
jgi:8-oxo-dGTP pyrophosphatase MutT (NUDIX family)